MGQRSHGLGSTDMVITRRRGEYPRQFLARLGERKRPCFRAAGDKAIAVRFDSRACHFTKHAGAFSAKPPAETSWSLFLLRWWKIQRCNTRASAIVDRLELAIGNSVVLLSTFVASTLSKETKCLHMI